MEFNNFCSLESQHVERRESFDKKVLTFTKTNLKPKFKAKKNTVNIDNNLSIENQNIDSQTESVTVTHFDNNSTQTNEYIYASPDDLSNNVVNHVINMSGALENPFEDPNLNNQNNDIFLQQVDSFITNNDTNIFSVTNILNSNTYYQNNINEISNIANNFTSIAEPNNNVYLNEIYDTFNIEHDLSNIPST